MSYTLTGTRYIGTGSLPVPKAGYDAVDTTTGNLYMCNAIGTSWNLAGNVNNVNLGLLALTGGTMTGSITGATGWSPLDSPNFTSSAKLDGVNLATTSDLSTTSTTILNSIAPKITEAVASTTSAISVNANIAKAQGFLFPIGTTKIEGATDTIPLPVFPSSGVAADITQCVWSVGIYSIPDNGNGLKKVLVTNPGAGLAYTSDCYRDDGVWPGHAVLSYMIIAVQA